MIREGDKLSPPLTNSQLTGCKNSRKRSWSPTKRGDQERFPIKMHSIPGKSPAIYKISVVQKPKEKSQILENQRFAIWRVPGAGAGNFNWSRLRLDSGK